MAEQTPLHNLTAAAGAVFTDDEGWEIPSHFGNTRTEYDNTLQTTSMFDVSYRGKVELTGADAGSFLHNLCTNDTLEMPVGAGCEAFLTNAKARVVAPINIYRLLLHDGREAFWLDAVPGLADKVVKHLDHFLISEAVELADRTQEYGQLHLAGPKAAAILERAIGDSVPDLAQHQHMVRTFGADATCSVRRHDPLGLPGFDILFLANRAEPIWQALLDAGAHPAGRDAYELLRIEAGTPVFGPDIDDDRFVVETGRIQQAICYTKGCFLGQEPIVMARDRGHVNRTFLGLRIDGDTPVNPGDKVLANDKEAGQVASSAVSPRYGAIALAYIRRGHQDPGTELELEAAGGRRKAVVSSLPFSGPPSQV